MKKLAEFARENKLNYKNLWREVKNGTASIKTTTKNGRIYVQEEATASKLAKFVDNEGKFYTPVLSGKDTIVASSTRRNAAATSTPTDEYYNISNGLTPFNNASQRTGGDGGGMFPVAEAILLTQKAYYNFSVFRNIIDFMTEFSCSKIFLQGGNAKARNFFENFFDSININALQDKFFREMYRSGNCLVYRFQVKAKQEDIDRLNKIYGATAAALTLPSKYILINPYDIGVQSNIVFGSNVIFFKRLNGYEVNRLRASETPEEKQFFDSLPEVTQKQIKAGSGTVLIPLDPERLYGVFFKKSDYESMAIPMGYPVLKDIEWKAEMKRVDMAVARTMQQVVLLVNMGYESKDGTYMFDGKAAESMQTLFASESVGKVLVADFTTKLTWAIPAIGDFLDPKKYEIVNQDIKEGLNYILTGGDSKFANQFISVKLFVERLKSGREMFLNEFLIPEMKKISENMGFKSCPTPKFEDIDLRDEAEWERIVTQLGSLGILTPQETLEAMNSGRLPTAEESIEHQNEYRAQRDKGLYEPLVGGPYDTAKLAKLTAAQKPAAQTNPSDLGGRPGNVKTKQTTKKVGISRGSIQEEMAIQSLYSLSKIKDNLILAANLKEKVKQYYAKAKNIKKFNDQQMFIINEISELIIADCKPNEWELNIEKYIKEPIASNEKNIKEIEEIALEHSLPHSLAAILLNSKLEKI
jgi:hypothetical protein